MALRTLPLLKASLRILVVDVGVLATATLRVPSRPSSSGGGALRRPQRRRRGVSARGRRGVHSRSGLQQKFRYEPPRCQGGHQRARAQSLPSRRQRRLQRAQGQLGRRLPASSLRQRRQRRGSGGSWEKGRLQVGQPRPLLALLVPLLLHLLTIRATQLHTGTVELLTTQGPLCLTRLPPAHRPTSGRGAARPGGVLQRRRPRHGHAQGPRQRVRTPADGPAGAASSTAGGAAAAAAAAAAADRPEQRRTNFRSLRPRQFAGAVPRAARRRRGACGLGLDEDIVDPVVAPRRRALKLQLHGGRPRLRMRPRAPRSRQARGGPEEAGQAGAPAAPLPARSRGRTEQVPIIVRSRTEIGESGGHPEPCIPSAGQ
mmetsp:Transcript_13991/g.49252  ORF Transcript_13991/g.49252 Transcript_13991/m.49252 type:complete len:372 (+) Transcript_13991:1279-2394(+)